MLFLEKDDKVQVDILLINDVAWQKLGKRKACMVFYLPDSGLKAVGHKTESLLAFRQSLFTDPEISVKQLLQLNRTEDPEWWDFTGLLSDA